MKPDTHCGTEKVVDGNGFLRRLGLAVVMFGLASAAIAQPAATAPAGIEVAPGVIELPVFEVTDTRILPPPESWRYAEVPGFEILSNASERETKRFVRDFLLLQTALDVLMPGITRGRSAVPTAIVICGRGKHFEKFTPSADVESTYSRNSLFLENPERAAIVIDFALQELRHSDGALEEADTYRAFYTEYFRHLVRRTAGHMPEWFEEGLVQVMSSIDFSRRTIEFGRIGDGFGGSKAGDFNVTLSRGGGGGGGGGGGQSFGGEGEGQAVRGGHGLALLPMDKMFAGKPRGPALRAWRAQCYAFVHLCLYGMNKKYQAGFLKFMQRLSDEPVSEELFKSCFQRTYKQMAIEIRGYAEFTVHNYVRMNAKKGEELPEPPPVTLVQAPDAVVGRLKGEVYRLGGHGTEARNALIAPYVRGERDPRLLAALGLDERLAGNDDRARKFLEAAATAGVDRARAWLELARMRYVEVREHPAGREGTLDAKQRDTVLTALMKARERPPALPAVYSLLADLWMNTADSPSREQFDVVVEGAVRFPRDPALVFRVALVAAKRGFAKEARALAEHGLKISRTDSDRERFGLLVQAFSRDDATVPAGNAPATGSPASIAPAVIIEPVP
ncbi:MAG: hypothetical protein Q7S40_27420 [Opitutaceae bacterium]|nr:hypothetical protein [Opitutaceae bacterium]